MARALVIGYGNLERGDDGAAFHVVNRLRPALGQPPLTPEDDGLDRLGAPVDAVFVRQLVPELALDAAPYARVVLVDAHVPEDPRPVVVERVEAAYRRPPVSHHLTPSMFAWLVATASAGRPEVFVVSVRARCFDHRRGLSPDTEFWIEVAARAAAGLAAGAPLSSGGGQGCPPADDT